MKPNKSPKPRAQDRTPSPNKTSLPKLKLKKRKPSRSKAGQARQAIRQLMEQLQADYRPTPSLQSCLVVDQILQCYQRSEPNQSSRAFFQHLRKMIAYDSLPPIQSQPSIPSKVFFCLLPSTTISGACLRPASVVGWQRVLPEMQDSLQRQNAQQGLTQRADPAQASILRLYQKESDAVQDSCIYLTSVGQQPTVTQSIAKLQSCQVEAEAQTDPPSCREALCQTNPKLLKDRGSGTVQEIRYFDHMDVQTDENEFQD